MNERQMQMLITQTIGRGCICETSSNSCHPVRHKWSRYNQNGTLGQNASIFCGKDGGSQEGQILLNLRPVDVPRMKKDAMKFGYFWGINDDRVNRVFVCLGNPTLEQIENVQYWLLQTIGVFSPDLDGSNEEESSTEESEDNESHTKENSSETKNNRGQIMDFYMKNNNHKGGSNQVAYYHSHQTLNHNGWLCDIQNGNDFAGVCRNLWLTSPTTIGFGVPNTGDILFIYQ